MNELAKMLKAAIESQADVVGDDTGIFVLGVKPFNVITRLIHEAGYDLESYRTGVIGEYCVLVPKNESK